MNGPLIPCKRFVIGLNCTRVFTPSSSVELRPIDTARHDATASSTIDLCHVSAGWHVHEQNNSFERVQTPADCRQFNSHRQPAATVELWRRVGRCELATRVLRTRGLKLEFHGISFLVASSSDTSDTTDFLMTSTRTHPATDHTHTHTHGRRSRQHLVKVVGFQLLAATTRRRRRCCCFRGISD